MACQNGIHHMEGRMRNSAMEYRVTDGTTDLAWKSDVLIVEPKSVLIENNPRPPGTTSNTVILHTYHLLHPSSHGLIKITNMPPPNFEDELNHVSNLNTLILKKLFDFVFVHPTRGNDKSFNVSSRAAEAEKRKELSNYDTNQVLLPMLTTPYTSSRSKFKAGIFSREAPELYESLLNTPVALGRVSGFYGQNVYQMTVDTAQSMVPGTKDFKRIRYC